MSAGLIVVLVTVTLAEIAATGRDGERYLDGVFYAGVGMSLVGAGLFAIRVMWARRGAERPL
jgi:hypothetical protein